MRIVWWRVASCAYWVESFDDSQGEPKTEVLNALSQFSRLAKQFTQGALKNKEAGAEGDN